jgi:8-amino-7-oxononanoate synthase
MKMYEKELVALKRAGRLRERRLFDEHLIDMASNDYLGLSQKPKQLKKAMKLLLTYQTLSPKASMLVNGYHPIHQTFERYMAELQGFEEGIVVGSGFLANLGLIDALVRKGDRLFMDESYHASGVMATESMRERVVFFAHNDVEDLKEKLARYGGKRQIVAVEGVYSMGGDLCKREIFELCEKRGVLMIVDEAHSAGVLGESFLGIFDHYGITPTPHHIKMGTLGKAYGAYGAYILSSKHIATFLLNRAKPLIYATAPSLFDTALALVNVQYIQKHLVRYRKKRERFYGLVQKHLGLKIESLILPLEVATNEATQKEQKRWLKRGYLIGAIRQPTVSRPILRIILNLGLSTKEVTTLLKQLKRKG